MTARLRAWRLGAVALLAIGCATDYQKAGLTGGFSETAIDATTFRVQFDGNTFTSRETVETYLMYRCAELTLEQGYEAFVVDASDTETRERSRYVPGSFIYGDRGRIVGYVPGYTTVDTRYLATATITLLRGEQPGSPPAQRAADLVRALGPRIKRP